MYKRQGTSAIPYLPQPWISEIGVSKENRSGTGAREKSPRAKKQKSPN